ncbi:MAG TPA: hypothetical protein VN231_01410 [Allosphingosinicella sp.]|nr:hypothetical protein [Allosphingosinicella sp.]
MLLLFLAQAATPAPDIQLDLRASARDVRIERSGETSLEVRGGAGSDVRVDKPASGGQRRLRNVDVRIRAEARVEDRRQDREVPATTSPE